ncbi:hypothetical protein A2U01_0075908 [Trifolium medium]|uniref:Uncharacterized protein n=1 Tax=Trifolium medium TaxID=97028 RepID=A0A392T0M2_9FABA|nr:hypothetical protein [Trifolium medium]
MKSALSVLAGRCALALLESALSILALIFDLWDVLGSYPAKGAPLPSPKVFAWGRRNPRTIRPLRSRRASWEGGLSLMACASTLFR